MTDWADESATLCFPDDYPGGVSRSLHKRIATALRKAREEGSISTAGILHRSLPVNVAEAYRRCATLAEIEADKYTEDARAALLAFAAVIRSLTSSA